MDSMNVVTYVLAPCLRGSSFSIHIPGREFEVQHGQNHQPGKMFFQGKSVEENNESQLHCKKHQGIISYMISYIYIISKNNISVFLLNIASYHTVSLTVY